MKSKYQDKFNLWHDKPVDKNGNPRSNNPMIYSAYAKALGLEYGDAQGYFEKCTVSLERNNILINRHPGKKTPVYSFDELIGAIYLGGTNDQFDIYNNLKANHFVYVGKGKPLHSRFFERLVAAMIEALAPKIIIKGFSIKVKKPGVQDRNDWWKYNLENVAHFAARLTPAHSYIVKKFFRKNYHIEEEKLWAFYRDCIEKDNHNSHQKNSSKNLLWLLHIMNGDEKRARKMKPWISFEKYFSANHPFTIAIKEKYGVK